MGALCPPACWTRFRSSPWAPSIATCPARSGTWDSRSWWWLPSTASWWSAMLSCWWSHCPRTPPPPCPSSPRTTECPAPPKAPAPASTWTKWSERGCCRWWHTARIYTSPTTPCRTCTHGCSQSPPSIWMWVWRGRSWRSLGTQTTATHAWDWKACYLTLTDIAWGSWGTTCAWISHRKSRRWRSVMKCTPHYKADRSMGRKCLHSRSSYSYRTKAEVVSVVGSYRSWTGSTVSSCGRIIGRDTAWARPASGIKWWRSLSRVRPAPLRLLWCPLRHAQYLSCSHH